MMNNMKKETLGVAIEVSTSTTNVNTPIEEVPVLGL
jgi:hypothetical protein